MIPLESRELRPGGLVLRTRWQLAASHPAARAGRQQAGGPDHDAAALQEPDRGGHGGGHREPGSIVPLVA